MNYDFATDTLQPTVSTADSPSLKFFKGLYQRENPGAGIVASQMFGRYQTRHMRTAKAGYRCTNEIVKLFTDDRTPTKFVRQVAMSPVNNFPPIKCAIQNKLTQTKSSKSLLPPFCRQY